MKSTRTSFSNGFKTFVNIPGKTYSILFLYWKCEIHSHTDWLNRSSRSKMRMFKSPKLCTKFPFRLKMWIRNGFLGISNRIPAPGKGIISTSRGGVSASVFVYERKLPENFHISYGRILPVTNIIIVNSVTSSANFSLCLFGFTWELSIQMDSRQTFKWIRGKINFILIIWLFIYITFPR